MAISRTGNGFTMTISRTGNGFTLSFDPVAACMLINYGQKRFQTILIIGSIPNTRWRMES